MTRAAPPRQAYQHHRASQVRQYSLAVRWMKVLLPLGAIALVGLIFLSGQERETVADFETAAKAAAIGAGMTLENPRFAGMTDTGEPFVVTAASALPDGASPDRIDLESPEGEMRLGDGRTLTVTALRGAIFRKEERLNLFGDVVIETSDGYRAFTDRVELDLDAKTANAPLAVTADGPQGGISADSLQVISSEGDGKSVILRFDGNVRVRYRPAS